MKFFAHIKGWKTIFYFSDVLGKKNNYSVYLPKNCNSPKKLIIVLHGKYGSIYEFVGSQLSNFAERENFIVVSPNPISYLFSEEMGERIVLEVLQEVGKHFSIDEKNVYLLGNSMGGLGALYIGFNNSETISGIITINCPASNIKVELFRYSKRKIPVFIAHGKKDKVISFRESQLLSNNLYELSIPASLNLVEGVGHELKVLDSMLPDIIKYFKLV